MAKHSKWSKVKNYKGAADAKRAAVFTKLGRVITVAAREGGADTTFNFKLRSAIDQALAANMPKDNIDRAVKKGTGEIASDQIEEIVYEGYGPGGAAVLVEALTDNRHRTAGNIKHAFTSHGGNLGATGSVQWMFVRHGAVTVARRPSEEQELALIDAGMEDVSPDDDGGATLYCSPDSLARLRQAAETAGLGVNSAEFEWNAKDAVAADPVQKEELTELMETLDDDEDVKAVYTNVKL